jgi:hypothetical protein
VSKGCPVHILTGALKALGDRTVTEAQLNKLIRLLAEIYWDNEVENVGS